MMRKTLGTTLVLLAIFISSSVAYAYSANIVARLDDQDITVEALATYVEDVAGDKYEPLLQNQEGLRKLADFLMNRTLLLEYARQTVNKNDTIVTNHNARSVDEDVMYLTALLQIEVQDKVTVADEDVDAYMAKHKIVTEKQARQEIESDLKSQLMGALIEKVRAGHAIKYF